jgi:hypothetical protein
VEALRVLWRTAVRVYAVKPAVEEIVITSTEVVLLGVGVKLLTGIE